MAALGLAALAVACRAALEHFAPGDCTYTVLLPAVVLAGVFCGTLPAILTACTAGLATFALVLWQAPQQGQTLGAGQIILIVDMLASATVIWATHALRRAAAASAQAEARLAEVFRQVPAAAAILEAPHGRLLLNSARSHEVLGHPALGGNSADDIRHYGGIDEAGQPYKPGAYPIVRALKFGEIVRGEPLRYRRPDGRILDLDVHAGPVRNADGKVVAAVGMAFDVTERREAERRLQESEAECRAAAQRLHAALEAGALGTWELDLASRRLRVDSAMAAMLGLAPEATELAQAQLLAFVHPDDKAAVYDVMRAAIEAGGRYADECRMLAANGSVRWVVSRGAVLKDAGKVIGVISDMTERRERENALHAALEARDVLMHEADHRIKNSLQLVVSLLRLQMKQSADLATRHALGEAIARVDAIANAHLALQDSPDLRTIQIDTMLAKLCDRIGLLNPSIDLVCAASSGLWMDAERAIPLGLMASELLTNALTHAFPPGQPGRVGLRLFRQAGRLEMVIEDAGAGLPQSHPGAGLGSTLVAMLARQIGASVVASSEPGLGVVVRVVLDVKLSEEAERSEEVLVSQ